MNWWCCYIINWAKCWPTCEPHATRIQSPLWIFFVYLIWYDTLERLVGFLCCWLMVWFDTCKFLIFWKSNLRFLLNSTNCWISFSFMVSWFIHSFIVIISLFILNRTTFCSHRNITFSICGIPNFCNFYYNPIYGILGLRPLLCDGLWLNHAPPV